MGYGFFRVSRVHRSLPFYEALGLAACGSRCNWRVWETKGGREDLSLEYFVGWLKVVDSASRTCFVYGCENSGDWNLLLSAQLDDEKLFRKEELGSFQHSCCFICLCWKSGLTRTQGLRAIFRSTGTSTIAIWELSLGVTGHCQCPALGPLIPLHAAYFVNMLAFLVRIYSAFDIYWRRNPRIWRLENRRTMMQPARIAARCEKPRMKILRGDKVSGAGRKDSGWIAYALKELHRINVSRCKCRKIAECLSPSQQHRRVQPTPFIHLAFRHQALKLTIIPLTPQIPG